MSGQQDHSVEKAAQPTLCAAGCGFYSNVGTAGLCSKCYREQQVREGQVQKATSAIHEALSKAPTSVPAPSVTPASSLPSEPAPAQPAAVSPSPAAVAAATGTPARPAPSTTRCLTCNKKVGLTGFSCRCQPDAVFCSQHRYAEAHSCNFDYKAAQRQQLAESNPLVQASKITRL